MSGVGVGPFVAAAASWIGVAVALGVWDGVGVALASNVGVIVGRAVGSRGSAAAPQAATSAVIVMIATVRQPTHFDRKGMTFNFRVCRR